MDTNTNTHMIDAVDTVMRHAGFDMEDENFKDTPKRWTKMLLHFCRPYDPSIDLGVAFEDNRLQMQLTSDVPPVYAHGMVIQSNIPFRAMCAHHLLPFIGVAHVGYIPKQRVVGLSKLARVVYGISHTTPSLQEHIGSRIVNALHKHLDCTGAMCIISATHGCMECRGVEEHGVKTSTSHVRGVFADNVAARNEFLAIVAMNLP